MNYVGIDLGTTNSAICSYDGEQVRLFKSPEQHDVTPSALFIDRRGNKYVGSRAYNNAARNPDSAATLFKRLMGSSTPIRLEGPGLTLTPEECSAEILKALFGYLPPDVRRDGDVGTVITVPAAFNQMQKESTLAAAEAAGVGSVTLMQEPVAAVMSVMRSRPNDGMFLIYDLGGGTLDIAVAESIGGRVSLLSHGGIAMCGGRDFDRLLFDNAVMPWLRDTFDLPEDIRSNPQFKPLLRMATWAAEKGKIELSQKESAVINLSEAEVGLRDLSGQDIYLEVAIDRSSFDDLVAGKLEDTVEAGRRALEKAGLTPHDVERIVFVGGPTQYPPLRETVARELGIASSTDVNPMTAVAEGAAVFAESIDWKSHNHGRKSVRGSVTTVESLDIALNYIARTSGPGARIVANVGGAVPVGTELQVDSLDTGWSSGRVALTSGVSVEVPLAKPGENTFKLFVFGPSGAPISLRQERIVISRTAATVDAIPASHSVGIEVREKRGGRVVLDYLVREGEHLPKKGTLRFRAEETLRSGSPGGLRFKIWEGDISDPIHDNRLIGMLEIRNSDIEGVIPAGAELMCDFEVHDSGSIILDVSVASVGSSFNRIRNFYRHDGGEIDYTKAHKLVSEQVEDVGRRLDDMRSKIQDQRLDRASEKLGSIRSEIGVDPESAMENIEAVHEVKRMMALTRTDHLPDTRRMELDRARRQFDGAVRQHARQAEESAFDNLCRTAERSINDPGGNFEIQLGELRQKTFVILWRQDWFVIDRFKRLAEQAYLFPDVQEHADLVASGSEALEQDDLGRLREVVVRLDMSRIASSTDEDMMAAANIVRY